MSAAERPQERVIDVGPTRIGRLADGCLLIAVLCVAVDRALVLEQPWPLLVPVLWALLSRRLAGVSVSRLVLRDGALRAVDARGVCRAAGALAPTASCSALAIEMTVLRPADRPARVVLWRDAVSEGDFRALTRAFRLQTPLVVSSASPAGGGSEVQAHR